ncbi:MAG: AbrB/MazE/SpoVT family DNA-binding domain-containing protein [Halobacteriota archaeon]
MRASVRVYNGGKVTIPKTIRDELGIEEGDAVEIDVVGVAADE